MVFFKEGTKGAEFHSLVAPEENEVVFIKHYPNAFRETGLHEYLHTMGITKLHVTGAMTNMCVDSTIRAGYDLGYKIVLHRDACAAPGLLGTKLIHYLTIKTLRSVFCTVKA